MRFLFFIAGVMILPALYALDVPVLTDQRLDSYEQRVRASYLDYSQQLDVEDAQVLIRFLARLPSDEVVSIDDLAALKNNVADLLIAQAPPAANLRAALEKAFKDSRQGVVWREYIVQKIPELALGLAGAEQKQALAFLRKRIDDTESVFAGTALLGLQRLQTASTPLVAAGEVRSAAHRLLAGEAYSPAIKLTALQVLSHYDARAARTQAREWLAGEFPIMLKVSALATLGQVGQAEDRLLLERYRSSPEFRLRTAARAALRKLQE